jgi:FdhE protein
LNKLDKAIEDWVAAHPYLQEIAKLQKPILNVLTGSSREGSSLEDVVSNWSQVEEELDKGLPALTSARWQQKALEAAAGIVVQLATALEDAELPVAFKQQMQILNRLFGEKPETAEHFVRKVLEQQASSFAEMTETEINDEVIILLVWSALSTVLAPLRSKLEEWGEEGRWGKPHCPLCGQFPAMAQLVRTKKGRERDLVCGCCQTRWRYKRMGCPYCRNEDDYRLSIIEPAETPELRLDTCGECKGYLKTYTGEGNEEVVMADWSTLHLDAVAKHKGFRRIGYQRYRL